MKTKAAFDPWEINSAHLFVMSAAVAHIADGVDRDPPWDDEYVAKLACGLTIRRFYGLRHTTGFYARTTLRLRRCKACVAEMQRRYPAQDTET
jgi:hypothetical protein